MKRLLQILFISGTFGLAAQPTFTASPSNACYIPSGPNFGTVTVSNNSLITTYSWSSVGATCTDSLVTSSGNSAQFQYMCCGMHTITCVAYVGATPNWTATTVVNLDCPPNLNISASAGTVMCFGFSNTLVATGAVTYTWGMGSTLNPVVVSPSVSTCYTVAGTDANGCSNWATKCIIVFPVSAVTIQSMAPICQGQTATLIANGASSYSWSTGAMSNSIVVQPNPSTCYTVQGFTSGCTSQASVCANVMPLPTLGSSTVPPICQGQAATLACWGASTYTWLPGSFWGNPVTVMPLSSMVYTLFGSNGNCVASTTVPVVVIPSPVLGIAGNTVVCEGSSTTLTVSGAPSVVWTHNSSTNNTVNVLPTAATLYTVTGTASNGCTSTKIQAVLADTTCAMVWPGDANSDGIVNSSDVFELGLYANSTGTSRNPGGNNYTAQYAAAWSGNGSNGQNAAHIDCNGDGTVNLADTLAIHNNFSLSHSFRYAQAESGGDITIVAPTLIDVATSSWYKFDILLGSSSNVIQNIYGIAFTISFDDDYVDNDQVYVRYPSSFLDAGNQNILFRKLNAAGDAFNCVSVRTDGNTVNGEGKIAELYIKNKKWPTNTGSMNVSVSGVTVIDAQANTTALSGDQKSVPVIIIIDGLAESNGLSKVVSMYPNPADQQLSIDVHNSKIVDIEICDLTGRKIVSSQVTGHADIDVSALSAGAYMVVFRSENESTVKKLLIR